MIFSSYIVAQTGRLRNLEEEIYRNNREGKHKLSQAKLLATLEKQNLSEAERVQLVFLMAATFRSINDYGSAIRYLKKAKHLSEYADEKDSLQMNINAEMAFAYFDDNNYTESEKIIKQIAAKNYKNLDADSKAYVIMQQGYIYFLRKEYRAAEKEYDLALSILKRTSACNQPAVLVKMMQLYSAENNLQKVDAVYRNCISQADSCKILKYKIYATEEINTIYQQHNDKEKVFLYSKVLDSLNKLYDREKNLSDMHVENEAFLENKNAKQQNFSIVTMVISAVVVVFLLVLGIYFYRRSTYYKKEKGKFKLELEQLKEELKIYSQAQFSNETEENDILNSQSLNKRQKEILRLIAKGCTNKEIAEKLSVTEATVKYHIRNLYAALDIKNRKEVIMRLSRKE